MPTIKQLPVANSVSASDVVPVSQGGTTRSLSIGNMLSSTQAAIALTPGKLLGRASPTAGGPEPLSVGIGLAVSSGMVSATGEDHTQLPAAGGLSAGDEVVVNSGGAAKRLPATMLRGLFSAGAGVTIDAAGAISAAGAGGAPATPIMAGVVKPGTGLGVAGDGTLNVQFGAGGAVSFNDARIVVAEPLAAGDLRRFGWVGDGRDETAVFAAALAALPGNGGHIVIPESVTGTTLGALTIDRPVTIRGAGGAGGGQTLLRPATPTTTMFTVTGPFVTIENLTIGPINPSIAKQTGGSYIRVMPSAARFRGIRLTLNEFYEGITVAGDVPTVELLSIFGFLYSTGLGQSKALLHFLGGLDVRVNGITANGPGTGTADIMAGIWVENLGDGTITNADIIAMGTDLLVNPGNGQGVTSLWVCDSFLDTAYRGAAWSPTGAGQIARCRMSNVWASSHTAEGIRIDPRVDGLDIDSPHVFLNGGQGISLAGGTNIRVRGGQIAQNGDNGVLVAAGVSDWSVEGVTIGATGGLSGNTGFAVKVAAGASDRYRISGNSVPGNAAGAIVDGGTGTHKSVWNNTGHLNDYYAYRDEGTGLLRFVGRQAGSSGFIFATDDGTERFRIDPGGATVGGQRVIHAGAVGSGLSWNGTTLSATGGSSLPISNTYTASGAIAVTDRFALVNSANACAMTLGAGTTDGQTLHVKRLGSGVVTVAGNFDGTAGAVLRADSASIRETLRLAWSAAMATWLVLG